VEAVDVIMPLVIYAKPGTHPARHMRVKYKRKPPKSGDLIFARDCVLESRSPWQRFSVCEIKDVGGQTLYYLEWM
jgi:hypothetical protein